MTAVGIDFGNRFCTIAVAQRNGIDVLLNEVSSRQNSTMVSFGEKERAIGESAATQHLRNLQNTITDVKLVLGRRADETDVVKELGALPMRWSSEENNISFEVLSRGEGKKFTPVQITGMILHRMKEITEKALEKPVKEVVVSVPGWWNDAQRRAMMDAIQISGWSCVKLQNEHAAVATLYGLYKANPAEGETQNVMFCDMGHTTTTVSIVEFTKGKVKVLSTAYDRGLGGRNFDKLLADHFANIFKTKYKIDIKTNKKATIRLEQACERLKKMFTTNPDATMSVDSIMNDIDVKGDMKRPEYDTLVAPLLKRFLKTVQRALDDAKLTCEKLDSVEIVGGSMRMLSLQSALADFSKKEISKTLNPEEAVAKGCALQCAMLTPYFKVKEITINDMYPYPIRVSWKNLSQGANANIPIEDTADVIAKGEPLPSKIKLLSFTRNEPFELLAEYKMDECVQTQSAPDEPLCGLDPKTQPLIARCVVSQLLAPGQTNPPELPASIRAKAKLTISGTFVFDGVQLLETVPDNEMPVDSKDTKAETKPETKANDTKQDTKTETKPEPMDATPTSPVTADTTADENKKKKVRRVELTFNESNASLPLKIVQNFAEEEGKMQADDRLLIETAEKKCALESLIYDIRDKIRDTGYGSFATEDDKAKLEKIMDGSLAWLYDEGAEATKSVYQQRIDEIQVISNPMVQRKAEAENRHHAVTLLRNLIEQHRSFAASNDPKYEHITPEERNTVLKACNDIESFINTKMQEQEKRPKVENPIITVAQINQKKADLDKICTPIINKPKPIPKPEPKPEPKPAEQKPAEQKPQEEPKTTDQKPQDSKTSTSGNGHPDVKMADQDASQTKTPEAKAKEMDLD